MTKERPLVALLPGVEALDPRVAVVEELAGRLRGFADAAGIDIEFRRFPAEAREAWISIEWLGRADAPASFSFALEAGRGLALLEGLAVHDALESVDWDGEADVAGASPGLSPVTRGRLGLLGQAMAAITGITTQQILRLPRHFIPLGHRSFRAWLYGDAIAALPQQIADHDGPASDYDGVVRGAVDLTAAALRTFEAASWKDLWSPRRSVEVLVNEVLNVPPDADPTLHRHVALLDRLLDAAGAVQDPGERQRIQEFLAPWIVKSTDRRQVMLGDLGATATRDDPVRFRRTGEAVWAVSSARTIARFVRTITVRPRSGIDHENQ